MHAQPWPGGREAAEVDTAGLRSGSQGNGRGPSRAGLGSGAGSWKVCLVEACSRGKGVRKVLIPGFHTPMACPSPEHLGRASLAG